MTNPGANETYELVRELRRTGLGTTYLALRTSAGTPPQAVSVRDYSLPGDGTADHEGLVTAARQSLAFRHPHVVPVLGYEAGGRHLLVVSEWVNGISLASFRTALLDQTEPAPLALVVRLALDLSRAAAAVRREHPFAKRMRLIVNESTVVTASGHLLSGEPGIVEAVTLANTTIAGGSVVTRLCQNGFDAEASSEATDVFAVGTLLWELITHQALPVTDPVEALRHQLVYPLCNRPLARRQGPPVPGGLASLVSRATAIDSTRRLADLELLSGELELVASLLPAERSSVRALIHRVAGPTLDRQRELQEQAVATQGNLSRPRRVYSSLGVLLDGHRAAGPSAGFPDEEAATRPAAPTSCRRLLAARPGIASTSGFRPRAAARAVPAAAGTLRDGTS